MKRFILITLLLVCSVAWGHNSMFTRTGSNSIYVESDHYTKDETDHSAELIVAKQRNGPLATIDLRFEGNCVRFLDS